MIKKILSIVLVFSMLNLNFLAATPLERGTMFIVRLLSTVKSNSKETISAIVDNDVKGKNGKILIKRGTPVQSATSGARSWLSVPNSPLLSDRRT